LEIKMKNKGQATVFIILGIIILIGVALSIYFLGGFGQDTKIAEQIILPENVEEINNAIDDCFEDKIDEYFLYLGTFGGNPYATNYYELENKSEDLNKYQYVYLSYQGNNLLSSIDDIEKNFELTLANDFFECFQEVDIGDSIEIDVEIEEMIEIIVINSASINMNNETYDLPEERYFEIEYDFIEFYSFIESLIENRASLDFELLLDSPYEITVLRPDENTIIYVVEDPSFALSGQNFEFSFAMDIE